MAVTTTTASTSTTTSTLIYHHSLLSSSSLPRTKTRRFTLKNPKPLSFSTTSTTTKTQHHHNNKSLSVFASSSSSSSSTSAATASLEALIFDCDGVILESEHLHRQAYNDAFSHFNVRCPSQPLPLYWDVDFYDDLQNRVGGGKPKMRWSSPLPLTSSFVF